MNASKTVILALVLVGLCACIAKHYQGQRGPRCLGPVCLGQDTWRDAESFFEKYGVGVERKNKFSAYWYIEDGSYVYISRYHGENKPINTIVISKYPYYSKHALPPIQPFGSLATEKGIKLGASYSELVTAYGEPSDVYTDSATLKSEVPDTWPVNLNDIKIVRYENEFGEHDHGPWSFFFFEKDVLIAIELSRAI